MATTAFAWSTPVEDDNGDIYSFIVTAQKNGVLILWAAKVCSNFNPSNCESTTSQSIDIDVRNFITPKIGPVSSLDLISLGDQTSILFIGGFNGKVKVN